MERPLVTIITPSFNHAKYLEQAVDSVLNQTYKNIEYFIVDDGSSDDSHKLIKRLKEKHPQIKIELHKENRGHVRISETVLKAKGEYISILSSDDWYLPDKIEKQVRKFQDLDDSYGVVYSGGFRYFEDKDLMVEVTSGYNMRKGYILKELLTEPFFIYPISPLIKRECMLKTPFLKGFRAEGEAIFFRIAIEYKFDFIKAPLVVMRDHSQNTGKDIETMLKDNLAVREYIFSLDNFPSDLKYLKKETISKIYFLKGWELLRIKKKYHSGFNYMLRATFLNKKYLLNARLYAALIINIVHKIRGIGAFK